MSDNIYLQVYNKLFIMQVNLFKLNYSFTFVDLLPIVIR